jgi:hypothetical protein
MENELNLATLAKYFSDEDKAPPRSQGVSQCSCLYAILSHRSRLAPVCPVWSRFPLLSEISSARALRD